MICHHYGSKPSGPAWPRIVREIAGAVTLERVHPLTIDQLALQLSSQCGRVLHFIAAALIRRRIPYALGMRCSILDQDARTFARIFYSSLAQGSSVEEALRQTRLALACSPQSEVIYINGLDQIEEDVNGVRDLSFLPTKPPVGIVFALCTRPTDTLQPLELRKPYQEYWLPPLSWADFDLVLRHRQITLDSHQTKHFYSVMGANALYLDLVARELVDAGALAPEQIIARITDNPDNLFSLAIERLKRPTLEWRILIKPILGALLAAREPLAVANLPMIIGREDEAVRIGLIRLGGLLDRDG